MATYAISDIHGRIGELNHLLDYIALGDQDTVVFLGDYIDRGPDSKAVIERLLELEANHSNAHFLLSNHEEMAMAAKHDRIGGRANQFAPTENLPIVGPISIGRV